MLGVESILARVRDDVKANFRRSNVSAVHRREPRRHEEYLPQHSNVAVCVRCNRELGPPQPPEYLVPHFGLVDVVKRDCR